MKKNNFSHLTLTELILSLEYQLSSVIITTQLLMLGELLLIKVFLRGELLVFILMNIRIFGRTRVFRKIFFVRRPLIGGNIPISIAMLVIIFDLL